MKVKLTMLSGGVGGARLARGLAAAPGVDLSVVVNVGDDEEIYGLHVSPDIDTVTYTIAGIEGPLGWGLADDSTAVMSHLADFGVDTEFKIGDGDLATNLYRTMRLKDGAPLSRVTADISAILEISCEVLPATDDRLRTEVLTGSGWTSFQEYFVLGGHEEEVSDIRFSGAKRSIPAPGVLDAIVGADVVVIGPSNPPLSIWPILAVPGITEAVGKASRVVAVSPLFAGKALKGPAHRVMASLGLPPGNEGVVAAYDGLLTDLVIDTSDAADRGNLTGPGLTVHVRNTRFPKKGEALAFAEWMVDLL